MEQGEALPIVDKIADLLKGLGATESLVILMTAVSSVIREVAATDLQEAKTHVNIISSGILKWYDDVLLKTL